MLSRYWYSRFAPDPEQLPRSQEARRSDAPVGAAPEYEIHGEFKMAADSRAYPDTYWLTVRELWDAGLSKSYITEQLTDTQSSVRFLAGASEMDWMS